MTHTGVSSARPIEDDTVRPRQTIQQFGVVGDEEHLRIGIFVVHSVEDFAQPRVDFPDSDEVVWFIDAEGPVAVECEVQHCVQADEDPLTIGELAEEIRLRLPPIAVAIVARQRDLQHPIPQSCVPQIHPFEALDHIGQVAKTSDRLLPAACTGTMLRSY